MLHMSDMGFVCCSISECCCKPVHYYYRKGKAQHFGSGVFSILDTILDAWLSRIETFHARISGFAMF